MNNTHPSEDNDHGMMVEKIWERYGKPKILTTEEKLIFLLSKDRFPYNTCAVYLILYAQSKMDKTEAQPKPSITPAEIMNKLLLQRTKVKYVLENLEPYELFHRAKHAIYPHPKKFKVETAKVALKKVNGDINETK